jgi:hypothetical protein
VLLCKPRAITPAPGCRGKLLVGAFLPYLQYLRVIVQSMLVQRGRTLMGAACKGHDYRERARCSRSPRLVINVR